MNHHEYFAEGVQSLCDNNRGKDHDHVHLRSQLIEYDSGLAALCREVFGDTVLKYTKPATRLRDHLAGYDPSTAPKFTWPERLTKVKAEIKEKAQARGDVAEKTSAASAREPAKQVGTPSFPRLDNFQVVLPIRVSHVFTCDSD